MAPKSQPTSARQELIEVIQSLTQQLQKADDAVLAMKSQARSQVNALEEESRGLRARVEQRDRERDDLIADKNALMTDKEELVALVNKEQSLRKEAEHQLSLTRQTLSNAQREAKHHQDSLALTDRHNASALAQARQDAENWKGQFERMNGLLQAQQLQIDNLVMTLKEYLSRSTLISEQPPSAEPLRNSERYVGPTITVPLASASRRVKREELESQIWQDEEQDGMEEDGSELDDLGHPESGPSRARPSRNQSQRRPPVANARQNEARARRRSSQHYVEVDEYADDGGDDEMALGYEARVSPMPHVQVRRNLIPAVVIPPHKTRNFTWMQTANNDAPDDDANRQQEAVNRSKSPSRAEQQPAGSTPFVFPIRSLLSTVQPHKAHPTVDQRVYQDLTASLQREVAARREAASGFYKLAPLGSKPSTSTTGGTDGTPPTAEVRSRDGLAQGRKTLVYPSHSQFGHQASDRELLQAIIPLPPMQPRAASSSDSHSSSSLRPLPLASKTERPRSVPVPEKPEMEPSKVNALMKVQDFAGDSQEQTPVNPVPSQNILPDNRPSESIAVDAASGSSDETSGAVTALTSQSSKKSTSTGFSDLVRLPPIPTGDDPDFGGSFNSSSSSRPGGTRPSQESGVVGQSGNASGASSSIDSRQRGPPVTTRLKYVQDENGFHHIVGREGTLTRCEDEPIRTPGAIQSYGVIIVLEEDLEEGRLLNVHRILGLGVPYLFSLECFTDVLPYDQAELLWKHVTFLQDPNIPDETPPDPESSEENLTDPQYARQKNSAKPKAHMEGPEVFVLSGWSEPHTVAEMEPRNQWRCWCAAHRPLVPKRTPPDSRADSRTNIAGSDGASGVSSEVVSLSNPPAFDEDHQRLIILEFELEHDEENPIYVRNQFGEATTSSGSRTSRTGSASGNASAKLGSGSPQPSSGASSGQTPTPGPGHQQANAEQAVDDFPPSAPLTNAALQALDTRPDQRTLNLPSLDQVFSSPDTQDPQSADVGSQQFGDDDDPFMLEGDDSWYPSVGDIHDSTTSRSKPIRALEKMRLMARGLGTQARQSPTMHRVRDTTRGSGGSSGRVSGTGSSLVGSGGSRGGGSTSSRASRRAAAMGGGNSVGTMDVFAVLADVIEQLGHATDIGSFLKVVVGVIKDLTQFHRVLAYQFDDKWNGQVVAELVDWSASHDLYKGLHFPASDIPAQARELYMINKVRSLYDRAQPTSRLVCRDFSDLDNPLDMTHCYLRAMSPIHCKYLENMGVRASMSVINTIPTQFHPTGYIVSNAEDLLTLFDADFGALVIGDGARILGPSEHGREVLAIAQYLRMKQYGMLQASSSIGKDYSDLTVPFGMDSIAGLLYVPLSPGGHDFIVFLRRGQLKDVLWAGKPHKPGAEATASLEPRTSFKAWSQTVMGRCRAWSDEQVETAGVLALVYGKARSGAKFPKVDLTLIRAVHGSMAAERLTLTIWDGSAVRTPLNQIIGYLELALEGELDDETRTNLQTTHKASKFNDRFDLQTLIEETVAPYEKDAARKGVDFFLNVERSPRAVLGDSRKISSVVANLTANAVKFTDSGSVTVECQPFNEPDGLRDSHTTATTREVAVEIIVSDTGCGMPNKKLEEIFRQFEQVEHEEHGQRPAPGLGLGLAVVARIVEQLGGQLRVDSQIGSGSRFSFLLPFTLPSDQRGNSSVIASGPPSRSTVSEVDDFVTAMSTSHMVREPVPEGAKQTSPAASVQRQPNDGLFYVQDSKTAVRAIKVDEFQLDRDHLASPSKERSGFDFGRMAPPRPIEEEETAPKRPFGQLRVLVVEDDKVNSSLLLKRLKKWNHTPVAVENGQEAKDLVQRDFDFDCVLMDLQMPIMDGYQATAAIRAFEETNKPPRTLPSHKVNGRMPILAVSASISENQHNDLWEVGLDGYLLKPIVWDRVQDLFRGTTDPEQRRKDMYITGSWERGGWLGWNEKLEPL
ncbi:Light-sensor Protein kinase [Tulasnella sp. 331]|nr:Light-sensor Protein kinase [Tulasnella sp. 331]